MRLADKLCEIGALVQISF